MKNGWIEVLCSFAFAVVAICVPVLCALSFFYEWHELLKAYLVIAVIADFGAILLTTLALLTKEA